MLKEFFSILLLAFFTAILFYLISAYLPSNLISPSHYIKSNNSNNYILNTTGTTNATNSSENLSYPIPPPVKNYTPSNSTIAYALQLINNDREKYGLMPVLLSNITSAQQHADNMLNYDYFSHWDIYGMKPYMRYTLLGGKGAVQENVAYIFQSNGVNVTSALKRMEYNMMYNDYNCCDNGHRYNILNPEHNQVSIGIAFNKTIVYFVEDFINNYISWVYNTPNMTGNIVTLKGEVADNYSLYDIEISYDPPVKNMTEAQLNNTSSYSYGNTVAGIGYHIQNRIFYFTNIMTLNASTYIIQNNKFDISFNMQPLIEKEGAGEYTLMLWLNSTTNSTSFLGATYTFFINNRGMPYTPKNI
ncbi:MAG: CAP domain-containing protein [Candidatus Micrarchaeia archaeon]